MRATASNVFIGGSETRLKNRPRSMNESPAPSPNPFLLSDSYAVNGKRRDSSGLDGVGESVSLESVAVGN